MDITSIIQHVFKQPSLDGVSLSELERFTARQPFFAVGQYLLLKKMQETHDPGFEKQLQKTRLYFENPLWLQQLLLRKKDGYSASFKQPEARYEHVENVADEQAIIENNNIVEEALSVTEPNVQFEPEENIPQYPASDIYQENTVESADFSEPAYPEITEETPEIDSHVEELTTEETVIRETETIEPSTQHIQQMNVVDLAEHNAIETEMEKTETVTSEFISDQPENVAALQNNQGDFFRENIIVESPEKGTDVQIEERAQHDIILPVPPSIKPAAEMEEPLVFQAYHTIDYFASQGIKISHKVDTSDKLGSQLKSFTEWLKTMKRLPPSKFEQQMAEKDSEVVVEMAAHSLEPKEVLTETMAEVLLKQGKKESAIEVYNKLSLLNPAKTPYFAAKIEAIKQN